MKFSRFVRDSGVTIALSGLGSVLGAVSLGLVARLLTTEGFGAFNFWRRGFGLLLPIMGLNLYLSVVHFGARNPPRLRFYVVSGAALLASASAITLILAIIAWPVIARATPEGARSFSLFIAAGVFAASVVVAPYVASALRAGFRNIAASFVELLSGAALAIVVVVYFLRADFIGDEIPLSVFFWLPAALTFLVSAGGFAYALRGVSSSSENSNKFPVRELMELSRFGVVRLPSNLLFAGLFFVPIFLTGLTGTLEEVAFAAAAIALIRLVDPVGTALSALLMPKAAQAAAIQSAVNDVIPYLFRIILGFAGFSAIVVSFVFFPLVVEFGLLWFGPAFWQSYPFLLPMALACGPYLGYLVLLGPVNGAVHFPLNNVALIAAVLVQIIVGIPAVMLLGPSGSLYATLAAISAMYITMAMMAARRLKLPWFEPVDWMMMSIVVVLGLAQSLVIDRQFNFDHGLSHMAYLVATRGAVLGIIFICLLRTRPTWFRALLARIRSQPSSSRGTSLEDTSK